jgi:hypothetical protein
MNQLPKQIPTKKGQWHTHTKFGAADEDLLLINLIPGCKYDYDI